MDEVAVEEVDVSLVDFRRGLTEYVNSVAYSGEVVVITRNGKRLARLVPCQGEQLGAEAARVDAVSATTAQLRIAAAAAAKRRRYSEAAALYRLAEARHPAELGELSARDRAALLARAEECERAAKGGSAER